jgi:hypothetical protein
LLDGLFRVSDYKTTLPPLWDRRGDLRLKLSEGLFEHLKRAREAPLVGVILRLVGHGIHAVQMARAARCVVIETCN